MPDVPDSWFQRRTDEELRDIRKILGDVVPRTEHELRWAVQEKNSQRLDKQLEDLTVGMEELRKEVREGHDELRDLINKNETDRLGNILPRWFLPFLAIFVPVVMTVIFHFWK